MPRSTYGYVSFVRNINCLHVGLVNLAQDTFCTECEGLMRLKTFSLYRSPPPLDWDLGGFLVYLVRL